MSLLRFLGLASTPDEQAADARGEGRGETATVRRIAGQLERLPPDEAKYLAAFAYVLARVANADLVVDANETHEMEHRVRALASLSDEEAALVVEIAKSQNRLLGGTENYVVTREFRAVSTPEQRLELLSCLFAVAAADGSISATENSEINAIADELGIARADVAGVRGRYRDKLGVLQNQPR